MSEFIRTIESKELRVEAKMLGLMMDRCPTKMGIAMMLPEARVKKLAQNGGTLPGYSSGTHLPFHSWKCCLIGALLSDYGQVCMGGLWSCLHRSFFARSSGVRALFPVVPTHNSGSFTGNARKIIMKPFYDAHYAHRYRGLYWCYCTGLLRAH